MNPADNSKINSRHPLPCSPPDKAAACRIYFSIRQQAAGAGFQAGSNPGSSLMKEPDSGTSYSLVLRPVPGNWRVPPWVRLRAFLKAALRAYGFRAEAVEPLPDDEPARLDRVNFNQAPGSSSVSG